MTPDEPEPSPPARTLGRVFIVVGGVAVLVGLFATVLMVVVFGVAAVALGGGLLAVANLRATSRARTARTLSGDPPPPASAPYRPPPGPLPPEPEPEPEPDDRGDRDDGGDDAAGAGTAREEDPPPASRGVSISDVEDADGNVIPDQDRPGRRPGAADDPQGA